MDIRGLVDDVVPRANGDPNIVRTSDGEPVEAPPQKAAAKGLFDGAEPHIAPVGANIDGITRRAVDAVSTPPLSNEVVVGESTGPKAMEAAPTTPSAPDVTRFDDGTKRVTRRGVDTERGKADVTEAYDEEDRIVSTDATFADGHRVESRWSYPADGHWSQIDTIRGPEGETLGAIITTFDGERVTRTVEPTNGPPQTDIWDRDGPVPTMQNVVAPALAIPVLLDLAAAAIGAVIVGKAIDDTIARQGSVASSVAVRWSVRPARIRARTTMAHRSESRATSDRLPDLRCRRFRRGSVLVGVKANSTIWPIDTRTLLRKSLSRMAGR